MSTELKIPSGGILVRIMPADSSPPPADISPPLAQSLPPPPERKSVTTKVLKKIKEANPNAIYAVEMDDKGHNLSITPTGTTWFYNDDKYSNPVNWQNYMPSSNRPMDPNKMNELKGKYTLFDMTSYEGGRRSSLRNNYKKSVRRVKSAKRASKSASRKYRNRT